MVMRMPAEAEATRVEPPHTRRQPAGRVPAGRLDHDDLGTEVGQQLGPIGTHHPSEVDDPEPFERLPEHRAHVAATAASAHGRWGMTTWAHGTYGRWNCRPSSD